MQCQDLELVLHCVGYQGYTLYFIWLELYHNNLTHGGYVIGGGTGELPPQRYEISVLGFCNLLMGFKLHICYLLLSWRMLFSNIHIYSTSSWAICTSLQIISAGLWECNCSCQHISSMLIVWYVFPSQWNGPTTTNDWARVDEMKKLSLLVHLVKLGEWKSRRE